jgi:hypothetical protein
LATFHDIYEPATRAVMEYNPKQNKKSYERSATGGHLIFSGAVSSCGGSIEEEAIEEAEAPAQAEPPPPPSELAVTEVKAPRRHRRRSAKNDDESAKSNGEQALVSADPPATNGHEPAESVPIALGDESPEAKTGDPDDGIPV